MGIVVWGQAAKVHLNKILKLQKRVLRLMNFGQYTSHAIPFFISAKVLPIDMLYFKSVAILMHDVYNNLTTLNFFNLFTSLHEVHKYNTRASLNNNFHVKQSRLNKQINNFQELELGYGRIVFLLICVISQKIYSRKHYMIYYFL